MAGKIQALIDMLRGSGGVGNGAGIIEQRKAYNDYVISQSEQGMQPLRFEDFVKQSSGQNANPYKR